MTDKTWGLTETGSVFHSFKANDTGICRSNIKAGVMFQREGGRTEDAVDRAVAGSPHLFRKCGSCAKREAAFRERAEASMQPVGEYDQACEGITGYGDAAPAAELAEHASMSNGECWQFGEVDGKIHQFNTATGLAECNDGIQKDPTRALFREAGYFLSGIQNYDTQVIEGSVCMRCRDVFKVAVYGAGYGGAAPSSECEIVVDAEAMRQADDALAFAMAAGAPADEIEDDECVDADGNVYPEHTEDDECRRCGAEMTGEPDVDGAGRTYVEYHFDISGPAKVFEAVVDAEAMRKAGDALASAMDAFELRAKLRADRRERAAAALVALWGTSGRTVTQKPTVEVDPFAGGPTPEEARANVVRRLPRGTRVEGTDMAGEPRTGTVNGYDVGAVNNPGHVNHQRIYVGVTWDGELSRGRAFADEMTVIAEQPAPRKSAPLAGTRVLFTPTIGEPRTGTVNGRNVGAINQPGHVLHGAVHVGVDWDGGGHDAVFADSLTEI